MVALAKSLLWAVFAACSVSALPTLNIDVKLPGITLAIASKLNATGAINIHQADRNRAARLRKLAWSNWNEKRDDGEIEVTNTAVTYTTTVNIGEPATTYTLLIDTGSSNTWVGADKPYRHTQTSQDTGKQVSVTYGGGSFSGEEYIDRVDLGNGLVINKQSIGVAQKQQSFGNGIDGILGVGPTDLTRGSIKGSQETIPTVTDNLASQGTIPAAVLAMFYAPYIENVPGVLTFGGPDESLYTGNLDYVGITQTWPSAAYWGIDQSIQYGGQTVMSSTAGIVDSGTTMILLPSDAFKTYVRVTGAVQDSATGFLKLTKAQYENLKPLNFVIGSKTYSLSPNGQIWPRALNSALGGDENHVYLVIGDIGTNSGQGFDFINGYLWMERFYTVFDSEKQRIGFATTKYTNAQDN